MDLRSAVAESDLTTLRVHYDWRNDRFGLALSREWDGDTDFARYARVFAVDQVPCRQPRALGGEQARELIDQRGAAAALSQLESLMRAGRHEMIVLNVHRDLGICTCNNVHSSVLGLNNGHHAIRAGGIRRHAPTEPEHEVLVDGLNLGRAMSFKNAGARIPFGGCKMTVRCEPFALDDEARLGFVAYGIDSGCFFTGPDMGFSPELADALRARFTQNIVGGPGGAMGPTGTPTARGTFLAIQEAALVAWGGGLEGRTAAVQGLGAVGLPLAKLLAEAGMKIVAADTDEARLHAAKLGIGAIRVVAPEAILQHECDLLAPCAIGGVLDAAAIDQLRCRMVYGSANNQLAAVSQDDEIELAARLDGRGILYQPDWTHNTAGVMAGWEEYLHQGDARLERIEPHLVRVCEEGTRDLLAEHRRTGKTPTALAYAQVERVIYPEA